MSPHGFDAQENFLIKTGALDQVKDIIVAVDNQNRLTYLNKAAVRQYRIDKEKSLGLKLTQLYKQLWFSPEDEQKAILSLKEKGYWEGVNVQLEPDGAKIVVETVVSSIKDEVGKEVGLLSISRDITSRVNVDDWLLESNQRLKYVVEAAGMMVYEIVDDTKEVVIVRGLEELLGYSVGEVPSTFEWWISQIHPEDKSIAQEQFHPTKPVNKVVNDYRIKMKNGEYIFVQGIAKVLWDKAGKALKIIGSMQNITERKKAEETLSKAKSQFELIFNSVTEGFANYKAVFDKTGKLDLLVLDINPAGAEQSGVNREEQIGKTWRQVWQGIPEEVFDIYRQVYETGKSTSFEHFSPITKAWYIVTVNKSAEDQFAVTFFDITERKKAEEKLAFQAQLLTRVSDAVFSVDTNFMITYWNEAAEKIFGWAKKEAIGKNSGELLKTKIDGSTRAQQVEKLWKDGSWAGEVYNLRKDGSYFNAEITVDVLKDAGGRAFGIVNIVRDITGRKKAEEELRKSERLYKSMFENTEEGFQLVEILFDEAGNAYDFRFLRVNEAYERQTGLKASEIVGKTVKEFLPGIEPFWISTYGNVAKSGKAVSFQQYNQNTNRWYDVYAFLYEENQVAALFSDITERKKLEKQLHDSERMAAIGQTAGMVGHDVRNPLQSISGELYLLNGSLADLPDSNQKNEMKESLDSITENIFYINKIVADLQDYARHISPEYSTVDLSSILVKIFENVRVPESIKLSIKVNDLEKLRTDPTLLQRALSNLVTNAVQAMPEGGILEITGHSEENKAVITVSDTGVGIPDDIKPKLFTPMMTTKAKGQGFGLAVSKRLIEAMKGSIRFESEKGKGTKFIIELPANP